MKEKKTYHFITVLKALAAIVIINSHFDSLYLIKALATGGAIGNALFFCVSGFLLYPIKKEMSEWIFPKLLRLYISTIPFVIISLLTTKKGTLQEMGIIKCFLWPTTYWFVGTIILFYVLYYFLRNVKTNKEFVVLFISLGVFYFLYYIFLLDTSDWVIETSGLNSLAGFFKLIYYFFIMMLGKWIRLNEDKAFNKTKIYAALAVLSFVSIYLMKWAMNKKPVLFHLQFLNQVSIIVFTFFVFFTLLSVEKKSNFLSPEGHIYKILMFLGNHTLEMYLTQFVIIYFCERLVFPFNVVIALVLIIISAYVVKLLTNLVTEKVMIFIKKYFKSRG